MLISSPERWWASESPNEPKQILEVLETVLAGWRQTITDRIAADGFAEGVAKRPALTQIYVHTDWDIQDNSVCAEAMRRKNRRSQNLLDAFLRTGEMYDAGPNRQIRP